MITFSHMYIMHLYILGYTISVRPTKTLLQEKKSVLKRTVIFIPPQKKMSTILSQMLTAIILKFEGENVFLVLCKPM